MKITKEQRKKIEQEMLNHGLSKGQIKIYMKLIPLLTKEDCDVIIKMDLGEKPKFNE